MVIIISAVGSNRIIGNGVGLPWHIPEEYDQFLGFIKDQSVIMGRRSYEIFKKDMVPKRMAVISRTLTEATTTVLSSLEEALDYCQEFPEDIFICGGQSVYEESMQYADYMYLSYIKGVHEGTVFFPEFYPDDWLIEQSTEHEQFTFVVYKRK